MKISIRKPILSDATKFRQTFNDKEIIKQLEGYKYPLSSKDAEKSLQKIINKNKKGNHHEFVITLNKKFVGLVVLEKPSKDKKIFTLGYAVGKKYWGKGIATEAVKLIIKLGFKKLKLKKIVADNDENNPSSARILQKNGFSFIKKIKRKRRKTDKKVNVLYWERLK